MRPILILVLPLLCSCAESKPPAAPPAPSGGACDDGALLGSKRVSCDRACVLGDEGPRCVASAEAADQEPCGAISCGSGCTCRGEGTSECLCPQLGPKKP